MAIPKYSELAKVDVLPYCDTRKAKDDLGRAVDVPYLNWAKCKALLHEQGAEKVVFYPCTNPNGSSLFMSDAVFTDKNGVTNRCYEVRVHVVIDDLEFDSQFPLMNGSNPVKDNSLTQQRLWNAQTRAFVKGVAMHTGLGFNLWLKDDTAIDTDDDLQSHKLSAIEKRVQQEYTRLITKGLSTSEVAERLEMTEDEVKVVFTYFSQLKRFEEKIQKLL